MFVYVVTKSVRCVCECILPCDLFPFAFLLLLLLFERRLIWHTSLCLFTICRLKCLEVISVNVDVLFYHTHTHTRPHVVMPARVQDVRVFKRRNETQKKDNKKPRFMWLFRSNCFSITIYLSVCTKIKRKWLSIGQQ